MELNQIHTEHEHASVSLKVILLVFAVILVGVLGYLVWDYNNTPDTTDYSSTTIKKTDNSTADEADETADWKTYTNSEYGFTLSFGDLWEGYEVKKRSDGDYGIDQNIPIYYFNVKSAGLDSSGVSYISSGYASMFAVSVFTLNQWDEYQAIEGPKHDTELDRNDTYVFSYAQSNDAPENTLDIYGDVSKVIATFKLTN